MFETKNLPIEIEHLIYKFYFSNNVLTKIKNNGYVVFHNMTDKLKDIICKDTFVIDYKYYKDEIFNNIEKDECVSCHRVGFPCFSCASHIQTNICIDGVRQSGQFDLFSNNFSGILYDWPYGEVYDKLANILYRFPPQQTLFNENYKK